MTRQSIFTLVTKLTILYIIFYKTIKIRLIIYVGEKLAKQIINTSIFGINKLAKIQFRS